MSQGADHTIQIDHGRTFCESYTQEHVGIIGYI